MQNQCFVRFQSCNQIFVKIKLLKTNINKILLCIVYQIASQFS